MAVKPVALSAPFRWLGESFALMRRNPGVVLGSAALVLMLTLLPTLLQFLVGAAMASNESVRASLQVFFSVVGLALLPPIMGGFYRILHAVHEGRPAQPFDLFAIFSDGVATRRMILTNLVFLLIMIVVVVGLAYAFGGQELLEFFRTVSTLKAGATELPPLPDGLLPLITAVTLLALVISTAKELANMQVALAAQSPLAATGEGFAGTLRNVGAFLMFFIPVALVLLIAGSIFLVLAALIAGALTVISPLLAAALIVPLTAVLGVLFYAVIYGFYYLAWRDVLGEASPPEAAPHHLAI